MTAALNRLRSRLDERRMKPMQHLGALDAQPVLRPLTTYLRRRRTRKWGALWPLLKFWWRHDPRLTETLILLLSERAAFRERADFAEEEVRKLRRALYSHAHFDDAQESRNRYEACGYWPMALN